MRVPRLVVLTVLVAAMTVPAADAAEETCHDRPATLVGEPGADVEGTDGPDVVVSNGARYLDLGAGDDLVCLTGAADRVDLDAGDGADNVDTTAVLGIASVDLGRGDDVYTGGAGRDWVYADRLPSDTQGPDVDHVSTGAGVDTVTTGADRGPYTEPTRGPEGLPDPDTIDLGPGDDLVQISGRLSAELDAVAHVDGGDGDADELQLVGATLADPLVLDNAVGAATADEALILSWSGFEHVVLDVHGPWADAEFVGGPGPDVLTSRVPLASVELGGGDDAFELVLDSRRPVSSTYGGGPGEDRLLVFAANDSIDARRTVLDLSGGRIAVALQHRVLRAGIAGFERHQVYARRLHVTGTSGADRVEWSACRGSVDGGPGADALTSLGLPFFGCAGGASAHDLEVRGGPGDDQLTGAEGPDVLLGEGGRDSADGGAGRDRCVAERVRRCETST